MLILLLMFLEKILKHHFLKVGGGLCKSIVVQKGGKHYMVIELVRDYDFSCGHHKWTTPNTLNWNNFQFFCFRKQNILEKLKLKKMQILLWTICGTVSMLRSNHIDVSQFLKLADVTPIVKKGMKKGIVDQLVYFQLYRNVWKDNVGSNIWFLWQCFLKISMQISERLKYSTLQFENVRKMEKCVCKGKYFGALLTDLSKAFDFLDHKLLIYKLNAYSLNIPALRLIHDYLLNRKQRIKIENIWIVFGVTQVLILRPLLFNIFLADLFFMISNIDIVDDKCWYCC